MLSEQKLRDIEKSPYKADFPLLSQNPDLTFLDSAATAQRPEVVLDAMREDFEQLSPDARAKLPDMLCASGVESPQWWWDVLVGEGDPLYRELEPLS